MSTNEPRKTVRERLEWILANRRATAAGKPMNADQLSLAAGLVRTHVATIMKGPNRQGASVATLERLAWAAQVSWHWMSTGAGDPNAKDVPPQPEPRAKKTPERYGQLPEWEGLVRAARSLPGRPKLPPEAFLAGADHPFDRTAKVDPELVWALSEYAWRTSSEEKQTAYTTRIATEEAEEDAKLHTLPARGKKLGRDPSSGHHRVR